MEQPTQFRSSLNGFNRQDVVRYMEFVNNKHAAQVAQLTNELEYLRGKQDTLDAGRVSQLEKDLSAAQAENEALRQRVAQLEKQLEGKQTAAPSESELEAYRRAERTERMARERAEQVYSETGAVLTQASSRIETALRQMTGISQQVTGQLDTLQTAIASSRLALQDAAQTIDKLKPSR